MNRVPAWLWLGLGALTLGLALGPGRERLGRVFTWAELTRSNAAQRLGLSNAPTAQAAEAMRALVENVVSPLQEQLGDRQIQITSGYRSQAVNEAVGGAEASQHMSGEAIDIKVPGMSAQQLVTFIENSGLPFDQLIWYDVARGGHVHVSYSQRRSNRRRVMYAPASGGYRTV